MSWPPVKAAHSDGSAEIPTNFSLDDVAVKYTAMSSKPKFNGHASKGLGSEAYPPALRELVPEGIWVTSCGGGNPFTLGMPGRGESVADIGCGAGIDVGIAAALVGSEGRVVGIDINAGMLQRAQSNVDMVKLQHTDDFGSVSFVQAPFDEPDHTSLTSHLGKYDIVISNGALCLSFSKPRAFAEAFSLLRPGGRLQLFDLCKVDDTVPAGLAQRTQQSWYSPEGPDVVTVESWANWVAGCLFPSELELMLTEAGFADVQMRGWTAFMTSPQTRGALIFAQKPAAKGDRHFFRNGKLVPALELCDLPRDVDSASARSKLWSI